MITKYGRIIITEKDVTITEFTFDCEGGGSEAIIKCIKEAMNWAISRVNTELDKPISFAETPVAQEKGCQCWSSGNGESHIVCNLHRKKEILK